MDEAYGVTKHEKWGKLSRSVHTKNRQGGLSLWVILSPAKYVHFSVHLVLEVYFMRDILKAVW